MKAKQRRSSLQRQGRSLIESIRQFLTPEVWKQAHSCTRKLRKRARWTLQPLVLTLLLMTWCTGDSQAERFETAKACCCVQLYKRRRPGTSWVGFQKALTKLPTAALRALASGIRRRLLTVFGAALLLVDGFVPLGVDGSRLECPRTAELEERLPNAGKADSAPTLWVTCLVHVGLGLLWAWRLGPGTASERQHLLAMLSTLPKAALIIGDAGFNGFFHAQAVLQAGGSFLIRMSAKVTLLTDAHVRAENWQDGRVYYWPQEAQRAALAPLRVRLIRVRSRARGRARGRRTKKDVWLLTNVLDTTRLSPALAAKFYRWRWENERMFRTYKRTLSKVKLLSRTVRLVHREAEASLLATQLLLALGAWAVRPSTRTTSDATQQRKQDNPERCSPRKVLLALRAEINACAAQRSRPSYAHRLAHARRDRRNRTSPRTRRPWPRRKDHEAPQPPKLLKLSGSQKARISRIEQRAA